MSILAKHQSFVNEQADFHDRQVQKVGGPTSWRGNLHKSTAEKFRSLASDLEAADAQLDAGPAVAAERKPVKPLQLSLSFEDVEGLPQELIDELSISEADRTEFHIINAIEEAGGVISLDRLLIALWKRTGEVHKRANITSRLYRMAQKNTVYSVPGKKGLYSTEQLSADDVAKLFGAAKVASD